MGIFNLFGNKKDVKKVYIATHKGRIRANNEDNYYVNGNTRLINENEKTETGEYSVPLLAVVCDGMGGESYGEIASEIAVKSADRLFKELSSASHEKYNDIVDNYVNSVNRCICDKLQNTSSKRSGTTFAMVYIDNENVYPFSLGDSRIYLFSDNQLTQISIDHTLAMKKYLSDIYTLKEAEESSDSHKLTLFLGVDYAKSGLGAERYVPLNWQKDMKILLCSDGVYDMCTDEELKGILSCNNDDYASAIRNKALEKGGADNITCIVIKSGDS